MSRERGAVTVYAASAAVLLTLLALVMTQVAGLVRLKHSVASAADLAALAASRASVAGEDGCNAAAELMKRNQARLASCRMDYDVATVVATGTSKAWWGQTWSFEQKARAAPDFYVDD
ncbi:MAG: Rv3654c family TadE-like protein [Aeromicrobium sp.]